LQLRGLQKTLKGGNFPLSPPSLFYLTWRKRPQKLFHFSPPGHSHLVTTRSWCCWLSFSFPSPQVRTREPPPKLFFPPNPMIRLIRPDWNPFFFFFLLSKPASFFPSARGSEESEGPSFFSFLVWSFLFFLSGKKKSPLFPIPSKRRRIPSPGCKFEEFLLTPLFPVRRDFFLIKRAGGPPFLPFIRVIICLLFFFFSSFRSWKNGHGVYVSSFPFLSLTAPCMSKHGPKNWLLPLSSGPRPGGF